MKSFRKFIQEEYHSILKGSPIFINPSKADIIEIGKTAEHESARFLAVAATKSVFIWDAAHPFVGGALNKKRIEDGTHNLLGGENVRKRVANGTHHFLTNPPSKGTIWITDGAVNKRLPKDQMIPVGYHKGMSKSEMKSNSSIVNL